MRLKLFILCFLLILMPAFSNAQFIGIGMRIPGASLTGGGGGIQVLNGQLIFLGQPLTFNGSILTYNP